MSAIYTYSTLSDALTAWPEDRNDEFIANIDRIIGSAELQLLRELNLAIFDEQDTASIAGNGFVVKPSGLVALRTMFYTNDAGKWSMIEPRTQEYVLDYGGVGDPLYRSEFGESRWRVAPKPSSAPLDVTIRYLKRPAGLSATVKTTWLSTYVPDALFYACLINAEEYLKADERLPTWKDRYYKEILPNTKRELAVSGYYEYTE